jgi:ring-1,2-phenylacetyl-CoA epoxidase subunit PaaE
MRNTFHKLEVINKSFLTEEAVLLTFGVPKNLSDAFTFLSGQYVTLKTEINSKEVRRSYSICTIPDEHQLSVVVKAIKGGLFSNFIKDKIEIGNHLEVSLPEGRFVCNINENSLQDIFLIAAGSGITPIISIIKNILHNKLLSTITLLFANKQIEDVIFYDELKSLQTQFSERLKIIYVFSRKKYINHHFGHINHDFLNYIIHDDLNFKNFSEFYLCGPQEMVKNVYAYLYSLGISKDIIKSELFYCLESKDAIEEVICEDIKSGQTKVEVIINQETHFVTINKTKNLLESLLEKELDVPYSCKNGNCSSCVGKVISGTVNMTGTDVLMDFEIEDGFILSCQSIPTSEELVISYDEY